MSVAPTNVPARPARISIGGAQDLFASTPEAATRRSPPAAASSAPSRRDDSWRALKRSMAPTTVLNRPVKRNQLTKSSCFRPISAARSRCFRSIRFERVLPSGVRTNSKVSPGGPSRRIALRRRSSSRSVGEVRRGAVRPGCVSTTSVSSSRATNGLTGLVPGSALARSRRSCSWRSSRSSGGGAPSIPGGWQMIRKPLLIGREAGRETLRAQTIASQARTGATRWAVKDSNLRPWD